MMNRPTKIIAILLAVIASLWLLYGMANSLFLRKRASLVDQIRVATASIGERKKARNDESRMDAEIQRYADRTLGGNEETVDHQLRSRLNRLVEQFQLQSPTVGPGTAPPRPKESPAKLMFSSSQSQIKLRKEKDFVELEGFISGSGTFDQVLRLVDSIEAEPWIKRIDEIKLDMRDNGAKFDVSIHLTTLFLPNHEPNPAHVPPAKTGGFDQYVTLVQNNPFRKPLPAPIASQAMTDPPVIAGPPPFPYEQWALTGLAQSPSGIEIWLLNHQTHESRRLGVGESLQDAVLVSTNGEAAEFRIGQQRFMVAVGKNLSDRTPVNQ